MAQENRGRIFTPHELLISSQALLRLTGALGFFTNAARWELTDYTQRARNFGAKLFYEPLRQSISPARQQLEVIDPQAPVLQDIDMLAEPARSERRSQDYLTKRIHWQVVYAVLEGQRFSSETTNGLSGIEHKVAEAHHTKSIPVRVYSAETNLLSAIRDPRLRMKIYSPPNQPELYGNALKTTVGISDVRKRVYEMIKKVGEVLPPGVDGVEVNLVSLMPIFENLQLGKEFTAALLAARNPYQPEKAFVQSVNIQPSRTDSAANVPYDAMQKTIDTVAEQNFQGPVVYSPGGGDPETEARDLQEKFGLGGGHGTET